MSRSGMSALLKTSHGPAKSISTAPLEMTKATGIAPLAGGLRAFGMTASPDVFWAREACSCRPAVHAVEIDPDIAAANPTAPDACSNFLRLRFSLFMPSSPRIVLNDEEVTPYAKQ